MFGFDSKDVFLGFTLGCVCFFGFEMEKQKTT